MFSVYCFNIQSIFINVKSKIKRFFICLKQVDLNKKWEYLKNLYLIVVEVIVDQIDQRLFQKVAENKVHLIARLLEAGGDIYTRDEYGKTLLMRVKPEFEKKDDATLSLKTSVAMARELLRLGADIYSTDHNGRNPLFYAVLSLDSQVVECMLDARAHINEKDSLGKTVLRALMDKASSYPIEKEIFLRQTVTLLLEKGANPYSKAKDGKTSIEVAPLCFQNMMREFIQRKNEKSFFKWCVVGILSRFCPSKKTKKEIELPIIHSSKEKGANE